MRTTLRFRSPLSTCPLDFEAMFGRVVRLTAIQTTLMQTKSWKFFMKRGVPVTQRELQSGRKLVKKSSKTLQKSRRLIMTESMEQVLPIKWALVKLKDFNRKKEKRWLPGFQVDGSLHNCGLPWQGAVSPQGSEWGKGMHLVLM